MQPHNVFLCGAVVSCELWAIHPLHCCIAPDSTRPRYTRSAVDTRSGHLHDRHGYPWIAMNLCSKLDACLWWVKASACTMRPQQPGEHSFIPSTNTLRICLRGLPPRTNLRHAADSGRPLECMHSSAPCSPNTPVLCYLPSISISEGWVGFVCVVPTSCGAVDIGHRFMSN